MKVEIRLSSEIKEPYAVIYTSEISQEIQQIAEDLQAKDQSVLTAFDAEKIVIINPEELYMVRIEAQQVILYCKEKKFTSNKRLYEIENQLGKNFMRISKTTLVNLKKINSVEPDFKGMMNLVLKNGLKDYISRKYLPDFKRYLGL